MDHCDHLISSSFLSNKSFPYVYLAWTLGFEIKQNIFFWKGLQPWWKTSNYDKCTASLDKIPQFFILFAIKLHLHKSSCSAIMGKLRPGEVRTSLRFYNKVHFPTAIFSSFKLRLLLKGPSVAHCLSLPAPSHCPRLCSPLHSPCRQSRAQGGPHHSQHPPAPVASESTCRAALCGTSKLWGPKTCWGCARGMRQQARASIQEPGDPESACSSATGFLQICREITFFPGISP